MDRKFDLMAMQGGIQTFGEKYGMDAMRTNRLQICCEELVDEMLEHCCPAQAQPEMKLDISYAEADQPENTVATEIYLPAEIRLVVLKTFPGADQ